MKKLDTILRRLSPDLEQEVADFALFLIKKQERKREKGKLKLDWRGALSDLGKKYDSVELQHKALEWWSA